MLIYLDANIIQYFADFDSFIFRKNELHSRISARMKKELIALQKMVEIELKLEHQDFENRWDVAAPRHLIKVLFSGRPTENQFGVYSHLIGSWKDVGQDNYYLPDEGEISMIEKSLRSLKFKHAADRWHLAEAIALRANWFLTNDRDIIEKSRGKRTQSEKKGIGIVQGVRIAYPSEFVDRISFHPVWGLILDEGIN